MIPGRRETEGAGRQAAVYGAFVVLVLVYTWPLVRNPSAHLREWLDVHYFVWELGWVARRIVEAPLALFDVNIFYPHGLTLAYSEPMLLPAVLVFLPVYTVSGNPILAHNVTIVLFQEAVGSRPSGRPSGANATRLGGRQGRKRAVTERLFAFVTTQPFRLEQLPFQSRNAPPTGRSRPARPSPETGPAEVRYSAHRGTSGGRPPSGRYTTSEPPPRPARARREPEGPPWRTTRW